MPIVPDLDVWCASVPVLLQIDKPSPVWTDHEYLWHVSLVRFDVHRRTETLAHYTEEPFVPTAGEVLVQALDEVYQVEAYPDFAAWCAQYGVWGETQNDQKFCVLTQNLKELRRVLGDSFSPVAAMVKARIEDGSAKTLGDIAGKYAALAAWSTITADQIDDVPAQQLLLAQARAAQKITDLMVQWHAKGVGWLLARLQDEADTLERVASATQLAQLKVVPEHVSTLWRQAYQELCPLMALAPSRSRA